MQSVTCSILDLSEYPVLLDHYGYGRDDATLLAKSKDEVLSRLYACDGVTFIAPEWGGMIPPALVNLLLLCANGSANGLPLGHKPAFALGLSASGGGANPIPMLKGFAAKNTHMTWMPLHAIIQNVDEFLAHNWLPSGDSRISQVQSRLVVGLTSLVIDTKQLKEVREALVILSKQHPFGQ